MFVELDTHAMIARSHLSMAGIVAIVYSRQRSRRRPPEVASFNGELVGGDPEIFLVR